MFRAVRCSSSGGQILLLQQLVLILIYLLTAIGLSPGGSSTVHIYTQTIHRTTQLTNWEEWGPCPVFASYTLAFALQLSEKQRKTCQGDKTSARRKNLSQGGKNLSKEENHQSSISITVKVCNIL